MKYILVTFLFDFLSADQQSNQLQNVLRIKNKKNFQFVIAVYNA